jgi:hypothetical protein
MLFRAANAIPRSPFVHFQNPSKFPEWQAWMRQNQPRTLIVWGRNDPFFLEAARGLIKETCSLEKIRMQM